MDKSTQIDTFNRFTQVSRETISSLKIYEDFLIKSNKNLNLIGKSTLNEIWTRHFLDSFQLIDFIDKNDKTLIDMGSGAGFPGVILAIGAKDRNISLKIQLIDKSPRKVNFLRELIKKLSLDVDVICENILSEQKIISQDVIVARAFKPLGIILELIHSKAKNWKKIFVFLGKTGKKELVHASKYWDIKYKQSVSVTNSDSLVLEINGIKKK
tara:strand:- start:114 stop:749 length:636 start_codon:yes stop_codon:yes gene_type:complete